jgi:type II secretory pathway pseudopilin PulG
MKKLLGQTGVTILEVLITLGIAGIILTAVFKAYLTQHENYMTQDTVTNIQQNARVVIDELSRHIRMAGNNLPQGIPALVAANTDPDTITLSYRINNCETSLSESMLGGTSVIKCSDDVSCFHDDQWAYIFEPDSGGGELFHISTVDSSSRYLYHSTTPLSKAYTINAIVVVIQQLKYFVDNVTDPDNPKLMLEILGRTPQVFAEDINDFQLRYTLKNGHVVDQPVLPEDIREVNLSIIGQTLDPSSTDSDIKYRTRVYSSSVNIRNL